MNKKMTCSSLAADGSDFLVTSTATGVVTPATGATSNSCRSGFDLDTLTLTLPGPLTPGGYTLTVKTGSDANTLLDDCGTPVPDGASLPFVLLPPPPTLLDSLTPPTCAPDELQLVFKTPIHCSSISPDGSDFTVTGPYPVTVSGASGVCDGNDTTSTILVKLSAPLSKAGNFTLHLVPGNDGNTLYNECGVTTPNASLSFSVLDTVSAVFNGKILNGCRNDTIQYTFPENNGVNKWTWVFDGTDTIRQETPPERIYGVPDSLARKVATLIVTNGFCSDTATAAIPLDNYMHPQFEAPNILCPKDYAQFLNNSTGNILGWEWQFGDGTISSLQTPPDHLYPGTGVETKYTVLLIVSNNGCSDTAAQQIDVLRSCYIAVPSAFTPNGDGLNDYLYPLNAFKADNLQFRVYNRFGQMVFETNDWTKKWDGTINGHPEPTGTFVWYLQYTDRDSGKKFFQKGTTILIR
jgi:gliding motility-associated-like protein